MLGWLVFCVWLALYMVVSLVVWSHAPDCHFKGVLTRMLRWTCPRQVVGEWLRFYLTVTRTAVGLVIGNFVGALVGGVFEKGLVGFWLMMIVFVLDDWLNDDDRWRRYLRAAKNKLRWLMELPVPPPLPRAEIG